MLVHAPLRFMIPTVVEKIACETTSALADGLENMFATGSLTTARFGGPAASATSERHSIPETRAGTTEAFIFN
jgi:hypothetical protein